MSIWQRTWCKSVECGRVHPLLTSVGVEPPPIHLLCWESFVFLLSMTVKVRAAFTSSTLFSLTCLVVLQSSNWCDNGSCLGLLHHDSGGCLLFALWPTQCWVCHIVWPPLLFTQCHFLLTCLCLCIHCATCH